MSQQTGFTLIELLIVLLIMGITAGVAVVTLVTNDRKLAHHTAAELTRELQLASTESLLRPATLSFALTRCGWRFEIFTEADTKHPAHWQPLTTHALPPTCLPSKLSMRLIAKGERIIFSPDGDVSPFLILFSRQINTPEWKIVRQPNGEIRMHPVSHDHAS